MNSDGVFVLRGDEWKVSFQGRVCSPAFNAKGPAQAYLDALRAGTRQPEYHQKEELR